MLMAVVEMEVVEVVVAVVTAHREDDGCECQSLHGLCAHLRMQRTTRNTCLLHVLSLPELLVCACYPRSLGRFDSDSTVNINTGEVIYRSYCWCRLLLAAASLG